MKKRWVPHREKSKEKGLLPLRKIICVCETVKKKKIYIYIYNFSCETYTKITVIDLIIVKLFRVCLVIFPLSFFHFKEK